MTRVRCPKGRRRGRSRALRSRHTRPPRSIRRGRRARAPGGAHARPRAPSRNPGNGGDEPARRRARSVPSPPSPVHRGRRRGRRWRRRAAGRATRTPRRTRSSWSRGTRWKRLESSGVVRSRPRFGDRRRPRTIRLVPRGRLLHLACDAPRRQPAREPRRTVRRTSRQYHQRVCRPGRTKLRLTWVHFPIGRTRGVAERVTSRGRTKRVGQSSRRFQTFPASVEAGA